MKLDPVDVVRVVDREGRLERERLGDLRARRVAVVVFLVSVLDDARVEAIARQVTFHDRQSVPPRLGIQGDRIEAPCRLASQGNGGRVAHDLPGAEPSTSTLVRARAGAPRAWPVARATSEAGHRS